MRSRRSLAAIALALTLLVAARASAAAECELPEPEGARALRSLLGPVRRHPEVEAWQQRLGEGVIPRFVLYLDAAQRRDGRCWYPVEVRAEGVPSLRFAVSADGRLRREP